MVPAERTADRMGILLEFLDPRLERAFRRQFVASQLKHIRIGVTAVVIIMNVFGVIDSVLYGDETDQLRIWSARLLIFTPMAIAFIAFTYRERYIESAQIVGFIVAALVGSLWLVLISDDGLHRSLFLMPNLIESAVCVLFLIGLTLKFSAPLLVFLSFLYSIILYQFALPVAMNVAIVMSVVVILGLLFLCAYQRETIARELFLKNRQEQRLANQRLRENRRDLEWLRGLATFLRHEVRQPIALVNTSLDIMQLERTNEAVARQIDNAETGVRHVWTLIDRATRATDLEAFVRQSQPRTIDLRPQIGALVDEFRQTYSGVSFTYDSPDDETLLLHVDPDLFREAIANLLNNAASFADDGSEVVISLTREEDTIATTITNAGPAVDDDIDSLFSPFRSTRAGDSDDHQGLGLYLVRLVAEHYGGSATLANLDDRQGVVASIVLPSRRPENRQPLRSRIKLRSKRV